MFSEKEREGDAGNWEILLNYYRGPFTLEESQVVLVKGYPSHARRPQPPTPPASLSPPPSNKKNPLHPLPPPSLLRLHITVLVAGMELLRSSERLAHNHAFGRSMCGMLYKSAA